MTTPEMWETFRAIDAAAAAVPGALVRHTARRDLGRVDVSVTSASGGNVAVRSLATLPAAEEAACIVADLRAEVLRRNAASACIRRVEADLDNE